MKRPSKKWRNVRLATLDRVRRSAMDPLEPLYTIYASVCLLYLAGFIRFQFFDYPDIFNLATALQLLILAVSGLLIPVLTGSVLTLCFAHRRLQRLTDE